MSPASGRTRLLRRARRSLGLGAVGLLALPLIGFSNAVDVVVDGELISTRTYATTVGEVLDELDLDVRAVDEVSPARAVAVDALDGDDAIEIERAITVAITLGGRELRQITGTFDTVADVLAAAHLSAQAVPEGVQPPPQASVADGDTIAVTLPTAIVVQVDGEDRRIETYATTAAEVLDELDVDLDEDDRVVGGRDAAITDGATVRVERIAQREEVEEVTLDADEERRDTDDLERGETRVEEEGRDGLRRDTFRIVERDGEMVERERIDSEVVREPVDRVVLVGTRPPPPPPAPAPAPEPRSTPSSGVWDRLASCESGGNWSLDTGNGYYGGLQFALGTWRNVGGSGYPHQHPKAEQIRRAEILVSRSGGSYRAHWPHCSAELGLP